MKRQDILLNTISKTSDWLTIKEAVKSSKKMSNTNLTESDIYRNALCGDIILSIYFQSSIKLRKIIVLDSKLKLKPLRDSPICQLAMLEKSCFINERNLVACSEGEFINPFHMIIDTHLIGYEHTVVQEFLADSLGITAPAMDENKANLGISVTILGNIYQVFEEIQWGKRIQKQLSRIPKDMASKIYKEIEPTLTNMYNTKNHFPIHNLPHDAYFVIKKSELEKLTNPEIINRNDQPSSTRMSTPLSRLLWLACQNNDVISPLITQPYKLVSIFEQWASTAGITDHISGDTLKAALKRGAPTSFITSRLS
ncbi:TPA: hypothetical protein ACPZF8_000860 [Yersinia enterocolitica]